MTAAIEDFFTAWAIEDDATRDAQLRGSLGGSIYYADPRTETAITSIDELLGYVGQFSKMAPGMPVTVAGTSKTLTHIRAVVRFGAGDHSQLGQYTADLDDAGKITRLVGFVGVGAPE